MTPEELNELRLLCENGHPSRIMAESRTFLPELLSHIDSHAERLKDAEKLLRHLEYFLPDKNCGYHEKCSICDDTRRFYTYYDKHLKPIEEKTDGR